MLRFIAQRTLGGLILVAAISAATYFLLYLGAGDIARGLLGPGATDATVAAKNTALGLDQPILTRFADWVAGAVRGDLGASWTTGQPVVQAMLGRLTVTITLVLGATVIAAVASVLLGVAAAMRGGWVDRIVQFLSVVGFAIPGFLVALFLVQVLALDLGWFRPTGFVPITTSVGGWIATITLPMLALSLAAVASIAPQIRGSVLDALRQDWVRTLRARGLSERRVVIKYVLRNSAGPALAALALQFVGLLSGAVIVEQVFAMPGLGQVSVAATAGGDIPMVMGLVVTVGIIVVLVNLLIDVAQGLLNPKVRIA